jgi:hypothetical protein
MGAAYELQLELRYMQYDFELVESCSKQTGRRGLVFKRKSRWVLSNSGVFSFVLVPNALATA